MSLNVSCPALEGHAFRKCLKGTAGTKACPERSVRRRLELDLPQAGRHFRRDRFFVFWRGRRNSNPRLGCGLENCGHGPENYQP